MDQHTIDIIDDENEGISSNADRESPAAEIQQRVKKGIESLDPLHKEACIFRVHRRLRQVNGMAYTPVLVSIGPYHHGNPQFKAMEEHKTRYLDSLLKRTNQGVEHYVEAMIKLEQRARNCYADPFDLRGGQKSFVEVMLLDACFVIEFLRKMLDGQLQADDDPIFNQSWMPTQIFRDLMLLENQLPFFVLSELHQMSHSPKTQNTDQFPELVLQPIKYMLPAAIYFKKDLLDGTSCPERKHFLDLVRNVCRPTGTASINTERSSNTEICMSVLCATELGEAGVKFKAKEDDSNTPVNLFDFKLKWKFNKFRWQRILKIPKFRVTDSTEIFFRNIIAYEQHSSAFEPKYFTDYMKFIDLLINTKDDVIQLCNHNIIENWLGDEEDVARMFNKLGDGVNLLPSFYYFKLCKQLTDHCNRWWNKAKAKLNHDYFNSPWASVSTVAAAFLLVLTVIQTLTSIGSFFNK